MPTNFLESNGLIGLIVGCILFLISGGFGAAVVNAVSASRRGIKGDALQKDRNAVEGFAALSEALQKDYARISGENEKMQQELDKLKESTTVQIRALQEEVIHLREEAAAEVEYSNSLINTLLVNTIEVPPRPRRLPRKKI